MDALSSILCLALGSALPLLVVFLLVRRGMRQLAVAGAYGDVSRRLGLPVDTRGVSLHGHLGDQRIWVGEVMVGHGPERRMMCWGVLDHERRLGLGLLLRRRGLSERLWRRARGPEVRLGPDELDRLLEAHGDEPERVRTLLDETVRELLLKMLRRWRDLVVTDQSVRVYLKQPLASAAELQELVEDLRALSSALVDARGRLPPPTALAASEASWRQLADAHGLELDTSYPSARGLLDGRRLHVGPVRTPQGYAAELKLVFRPHRTLGLHLKAQVEPDGYWSVGQDIQFGDASFDGAFVVKGYDPDAVRELLTPEARELLLELHRAGGLEVDDVRLHLTNLPLDPQRLEGLLGTAIAAAAAMGW